NHGRSEEDQQQLACSASKLAELRAVGGRESLDACAKRPCLFTLGSYPLCGPIAPRTIEAAAPRASAYWNPQGPESLCLRAAVFRVLCQPRRSFAQSSLLALLQPGAIQGGGRLLRHRSLFPVQGGSCSRLRAAPALSEGTARRHFLPDVRSAYDVAPALRGLECMPLRLGNTGSRQGGVFPKGELVSEGRCQ